jgi:hypothetical protein
MLRAEHALSTSYSPYRGLQELHIDGRDEFSIKYLQLNHFHGDCFLRVNRCYLQYAQWTPRNLYIIADQVYHYGGSTDVQQTLRISANFLDNRVGKIAAKKLYLSSLIQEGAVGDHQPSFLDNRGGWIQVGDRSQQRPTQEEGIISYDLVANEAGIIELHGQGYLLLGVLANQAGSVLSYTTTYLRLAHLNTNQGRLLIAGEGAQGVIYLPNQQRNGALILPEELSSEFGRSRLIQEISEASWKVILEPSDPHLLNQIAAEADLVRHRDLQPLIQAIRDQKSPLSSDLYYNKNHRRLGLGDTPEPHALYRYLLTRAIVKSPFDKLFRMEGLRRVELVGVEQLNLFGTHYHFKSNVVIKVGKLVGEGASLTGDGKMRVEVVLPGNLSKIQIAAKKQLQVRLEEGLLEESTLKGGEEQLRGGKKLRLSRVASRSQGALKIKGESQVECSDSTLQAGSGDLTVEFGSGRFARSRLQALEGNVVLQGSREGTSITELTLEESTLHACHEFKTMEIDQEVISDSVLVAEKHLLSGNVQRWEGKNGWFGERLSSRGRELEIAKGSHTLTIGHAELLTNSLEAKESWLQITGELVGDNEKVELVKSSLEIGRGASLRGDIGTMRESEIWSQKEITGHFNDLTLSSGTLISDRGLISLDTSELALKGDSALRSSVGTYLRGDKKLDLEGKLSCLSPTLLMASSEGVANLKESLVHFQGEFLHLSGLEVTLQETDLELLQGSLLLHGREKATVEEGVFNLEKGGLIASPALKVQGTTLVGVQPNAPLRFVGADALILKKSVADGTTILCHGKKSEISDCRLISEKGFIELEGSKQLHLSADNLIAGGGGILLRSSQELKLKGITHLLAPWTKLVGEGGECLMENLSLLVEGGPLGLEGQILEATGSALKITGGDLTLNLSGATFTESCLLLPQGELKGSIAGELHLKESLFDATGELTVDTLKLHQSDVIHSQPKLGEGSLIFTIGSSADLDGGDLSQVQLQAAGGKELDSLNIRKSLILSKEALLASVWRVATISESFLGMEQGDWRFNGDNWTVSGSILATLSGGFHFQGGQGLFTDLLLQAPKEMSWSGAEVTLNGVDLGEVEGRVTFDGGGALHLTQVEGYLEGGLQLQSSTNGVMSNCFFSVKDLHASSIETLSITNSLVQVWEAIRLSGAGLVESESLLSAEGRIVLDSPSVESSGVWAGEVIEGTQPLDRLEIKGAMLGTKQIKLDCNSPIDLEGIFLSPDLTLKGQWGKSLGWCIGTEMGLTLPGGWEEQGPTFWANELLRATLGGSTFQKDLLLPGKVVLESRGGIHAEAAVTTLKGVFCNTSGSLLWNRGAALSWGPMTFKSGEEVMLYHLASRAGGQIHCGENRSVSNGGTWLVDTLAVEGNLENLPLKGGAMPYTYTKGFTHSKGRWRESGIFAVEQTPVFNGLSNLQVSPLGMVATRGQLTLPPNSLLLNQGEISASRAEIRVSSQQDIGKVLAPIQRITIQQGGLRFNQEQTFPNELHCEVRQGEVLFGAPTTALSLRIVAPTSPLTIRPGAILRTKDALNFHALRIKQDANLYVQGNASFQASQGMCTGLRVVTAIDGNLTVDFPNSPWLHHGSRLEVGGRIRGRYRDLKLYPYAPGVNLQPRVWQRYAAIPGNLDGGYLSPPVRPLPRHQVDSEGFVYASVVTGGGMEGRGNFHSIGGKLYSHGEVHLLDGTTLNHNLVHLYEWVERKRKAMGTKHTFIHHKEEQQIATAAIMSRSKVKITGTLLDNSGKIYGSRLEGAVKNLNNLQGRVWRGPTSVENQIQISTLRQELAEVGDRVEGQRNRVQASLEKLLEEVTQLTETKLNRETAQIVGGRVALKVEKVARNTGVIKGEQKLTLEAHELHNDRPELLRKQYATEYRRGGRRKQVGLVLREAGDGGELLGGRIELKAHEYHSTGGIAHAERFAHYQFDHATLNPFLQERLHRLELGSIDRVKGAKGYSIAFDHLPSALLSDGKMVYQGDTLHQEGSAILSEKDCWMTLRKGGTHVAAQGHYIAENRRGVSRSAYREAPVITPAMLGLKGGNFLYETGEGGITMRGVQVLAGSESFLSMNSKGKIDLDSAVEHLVEKRSRRGVKGLQAYHTSTKTNLGHVQQTSLQGHDIFVRTKEKLIKRGVVTQATGEVLFSGDKGVQSLAKVVQQQMVQKEISLGVSFFCSDAILKAARGGSAREVTSSLLHEHGITGSLYDLFSSKSTGEAICRGVLAAVKVADLGSTLAKGFLQGGLTGFRNALTNQLGLTDPQGKFKPTITLRLGGSRTTTNWNQTYSSTTVGENITYASSDGAVTLQAEQVHASQDIVLAGKKGVEILSQEQSCSSKRVGMGVSASVQVGKDPSLLSVGVDGSYASRSSTQQIGSNLDSNRLTVLSGDRIVVEASKLKGKERVLLDAKGDIDLTSLHNSSKSRSVSGSLKFGSGVSGSYSASSSKEQKIAPTVVSGEKIELRSGGVLTQTAAQLHDSQGRAHTNPEILAKELRYKELREYERGRSIALEASVQKGKGLPVYAVLSKQQQEQVAVLKNVANKSVPEVIQEYGHSNKLNLVMGIPNLPKLKEELRDLEQIGKLMMTPLPNSMKNHPKKNLCRQLVAQGYDLQDVLEALEIAQEQAALEDPEPLEKEQEEEAIRENTQEELDELEQELLKERVEIPVEEITQEELDELERQVEVLLQEEGVDPVEVEEESGDEAIQEGAVKIQPPQEKKVEVAIGFQEVPSDRKFGVGVTDPVEWEVAQIMCDKYTQEMVEKRREYLKLQSMLSKTYDAMAKERAILNNNPTGMAALNAISMLDVLLERAQEQRTLLADYLNYAGVPVNLLLEDPRDPEGPERIALFERGPEDRGILRQKDQAHVEGCTKVGNKRAVINSKPMKIVFVTGIYNDSDKALESGRMIQKCVAASLGITDPQEQKNLEVYIINCNMGIGTIAPQIFAQPTFEMRAVGQQLKNLTEDGSELVVFCHSMGVKLLHESIKNKMVEGDKITAYAFGGADIIDSKLVKHCVNYIDAKDPICQITPYIRDRVLLAILLAVQSEKELKPETLQALVMDHYMETLKRYSKVKDFCEDGLQERIQELMKQEKAILIAMHEKNEEDRVEILLDSKWITHALDSKSYQGAIEKASENLLEEERNRMQCGE